jgi:hypothetical protein
MPWMSDVPNIRLIGVGGRLELWQVNRIGQNGNFAA